MMDLREFLLARLIEEQAAAVVMAAAPPRWFATLHPHDGDPFELPLVNATLSPDRMRAACEAKRRIMEGCVESQFQWVLEEMATAYRDHPDYQPEWRP